MTAPGHVGRPGSRADLKQRVPALERRIDFQRRHPDISITVRPDEEGTRLVFDVTEPGRAPATYKNVTLMLDDLESRHDK
jgi:hypothetical protein